jgi:enterobactin synthetase component D
MAELGLSPCPVLRAGDRRPLWPADRIGSITHAGDVAIAAVALARARRGIGIDLEETARITQRLFGRLFTDGELAGFRRGDSRLPGLLFSAKEAVYKAVNPSVGRFIAFQEVEVRVDWPSRTFWPQYLGEHAPNAIMESGIGHFCFFERYVLTVFMIPR